MRMLFIYVALMWVLSCDSYITVPESQDINYANPSQPYFLPEPGDYVTGDIITIYADDSIIYTVDGTKPTAKNYYSGGNQAVSLTITATTTIKAVAYKNGYYSKVVTQTYTY